MEIGAKSLAPGHPFFCHLAKKMVIFLFLSKKLYEYAALLSSHALYTIGLSTSM